jgi:hypothetical protein
MAGLEDLTDADRRGIEAARDRLHLEFAGSPAADNVDGVLDDLVQQVVADANVTTFIGVLVERTARERLRAEETATR